MKKIRLKQPYASMVVCGAFNSIPNAWGYVPKGEKIFIFADELDECFRSGFNFEQDYEKKISNEMFLGNIEDDFDHFQCNAFIGCVISCHTTNKSGHWSGNDALLYVSDPCQFYHPVEGYETSFLLLEQQRKHKAILKRMWLEGDRLMLPVSESMWEAANHIKRGQALFLFWESYMNEIFSSWGSEEKPGDDVTEVAILYKKRKLLFDGCTIGMSIAFKQFIFSIEPTSIIVSHDMIQSISDRDMLEVEEKKEKKRVEYVRFISTPMGGMTGWKRR